MKQCPNGVCESSKFQMCCFNQHEHISYETSCGYFMFLFGVDHLICWVSGDSRNISQTCSWQTCLCRAQYSIMTQLCKTFQTSHTYCNSSCVLGMIWCHFCESSWIMTSPLRDYDARWLKGDTMSSCSIFPLIWPLRIDRLCYTQIACKWDKKFNLADEQRDR